MVIMLLFFQKSLIFLRGYGRLEIESKIWYVKFKMAKKFKLYQLLLEPDINQALGVLAKKKHSKKSIINSYRNTSVS